MAPYQNDTLPIRVRVQDLLARMTTQEKISQVNQHLYGWQSYTRHGSEFTLTDQFKAHVAWGGGLGALYGLFRADPWSGRTLENGIPAAQSATVSNMVQQYVITHSRLGIPALIVEEAPHGHQALGAVSYPTNLGKSNSFDPALVAQCAQLQAAELAAKGVHLALVSTLDLLKDPRWGRSEETFGESPTLTAAYTQAVIRGFQGDLISDDCFLDHPADANRHIGVVIKHLIGQGDALGGHNAGTVPLGEREVREVYGPLVASIRHAVGVMAAYNDIDGVPCHANRQLLTRWLRTANHFQGLVMADGTALDRLTDLTGSVAAAAQQALTAGVDLSLWDDVYTHIDQALAADPTLMTALDTAVARVLAVKFLLGLFDQPLVSPSEAAKLPKIITASHQANAKLAVESMTLVKNNGVLPLARNQKVAVIGPHTASIYDWLGDYTAPQAPDQFTSLTDAVRPYASQVCTALGSQLRVGVPDQDYRWLDEAEDCASESDAVILTLGGSSARAFDMHFLTNGALAAPQGNTDTGENVDLADLSLSADQLSLLRVIKNTGKPLIVVMVQGRPYDIRPVLAIADAVLLAWYPGQAGPQAVADILFGQTTPTGRLAISYPRSSGQLPVYYYQRHAAKNADYLDESGAPLLPFGAGLDYTTWIVHSLSLTHDLIEQRTAITVTAANTGQYDSSLPLLLFGRFRGTTVLPREKQLLATRRVTIPAGQKQTVTFTVPDTALTYYDAHMRSVLPDQVTFSVGDQTQTITTRYFHVKEN
ncbi:glycoside hydrolase family 3 N-terminal domain-containing protein [Schleiferilactobacillus harbinensis]|uniref:glycoside hydrolase family 3 N-terminal domain-containing protein n=1 Tax=Schleiferilactobacillus harbinensis TaxID=304207 RepID=UPI00242F2FBD|nr:glycoside hydrolase family 3 N-terminal domain-containing protein [Schleiferilactobacillus harbinensis]MCI1686800.1 glycoside hydrolase family 3 C-terminal domain-containing protein [Schleiferilactobacillus harbinensis]MCI1782675.1 glycoside hydrolase family 3 C-terminal domain-containing protein [Schleiferilactobacillus harbinensis]MCI1849619.1 glycoside hydrolase family 3 C-terminal domain-containing protein [Schleiferilactobacillus harbinensis]